MKKLIVLSILVISTSVFAQGGPGKEPCCCKQEGSKGKVMLKKPRCTGVWKDVLVTTGTCINGTTVPTYQYPGCFAVAEPSAVPADKFNH